jgi:hypothetical protein
VLLLPESEPLAAPAQRFTLMVTATVTLTVTVTITVYYDYTSNGWQAIAPQQLLPVSQALCNRDAPTIASELVRERHNHVLVTTCYNSILLEQ